MLHLRERQQSRSYADHLLDKRRRRIFKMLSCLARWESETQAHHKRLSQAQTKIRRELFTRKWQNQKSERWCRHRWGHRKHKQWNFLYQPLYHLQHNDQYHKQQQCSAAIGEHKQHLDLTRLCWEISNGDRESRVYWVLEEKTIHLHWPILW